MTITIYVYQITMLCSLNLYNVICQLYLSKTGGKNIYIVTSPEVVRPSLSEEVAFQLKAAGRDMSGRKQETVM